MAHIRPGGTTVTQRSLVVTVKTLCMGNMKNGQKMAIICLKEAIITVPSLANGLTGIVMGKSEQQAPMQITAEQEHGKNGTRTAVSEDLENIKVNMR